MDYPNFILGSAFPLEEKSIAIVRAVLASRHLLGLIATAQCLDHRSPAFIEHDLNMFLATLSAADEAMRAFRDADTLGCFRDLPVQWLPAVGEALARARAACDKSDAKSLFSRAIVKCRNNVGAHWSQKLIERSLERLAQEELPVHAGTGQIYSTTVPMFRAIVLDVLKHLLPGEDPEELTKEIAKAQIALCAVCDAAYATAIKRDLGSPLFPKR